MHSIVPVVEWQTHQLEVLDEKMLSLINRIDDERMESLTTGDFLVINAMYLQREERVYCKGKTRGSK